MENKQENIETCWFCEKNTADNKSPAEVGMYKIINSNDSVLRTMNTGWENTTVFIPRCVQCKLIHDRTENHVQWGWRVGLLLGGILSLVIRLLFSIKLIILVGITFGMAIVFGLIGWAISRMFAPKEIKDQGHATKHHYVRRKEEEGWKIGDKPIAGV